MADLTLTQLIETACDDPDDVGTLMALTDRLSEASPEDRLEAVTGWARTAKRDKQLGEPFRAYEPSSPLIGDQEMVSLSYVISRHDPRPDARKYAVRELRHKMSLRLIETLQSGRRYVILHRWSERPFHDRFAFPTAIGSDLEMTLEVTIIRMREQANVGVCRQAVSGVEVE